MLMKKIILVITLMCLYIGGVCGQSSEVKPAVANGEKSDAAENSVVCVGVPQTPILSCSGGTTLQPNSTYELQAISAGAQTYTWSTASSAVTLEPTDPTSNTIMIRTGGSTGMSNVIIVICYTTNECGKSTTSRIRLSYE